MGVLRPNPTPAEIIPSGGKKNLLLASMISIADDNALTINPADGKLFVSGTDIPTPDPDNTEPIEP